MIDLFIALLILSPIEIPVPREMPKPLWDSLKRVALVIEVVGPHEKWRNDFFLELKYVREYETKLQKAPRLEESFRFYINIDDASNCVNGNLKYMDSLENNVYYHNFEKGQTLRETVEESMFLCGVWKELKAAIDPTVSWVVRRMSLMRLRDLIGQEDYYKGKLPPPVPYWRFSVN